MTLAFQLLKEMNYLALLMQQNCKVSLVYTERNVRSNAISSTQHFNTKAHFRKHKICIIFFVLPEKESLVNELPKKKILSKANRIVVKRKQNLKKMLLNKHRNEIMTRECLMTVFSVENGTEKEK